MSVGARAGSRRHHCWRARRRRLRAWDAFGGACRGPRSTLPLPCRIGCPAVAAGLHARPAAAPGGGPRLHGRSQLWLYFAAAASSENPACNAGCAGGRRFALCPLPTAQSLNDTRKPISRLHLCYSSYSAAGAVLQGVISAFGRDPRAAVAGPDQFDASQYIKHRKTCCRALGFNGPPRAHRRCCTPAAPMHNATGARPRAPARHLEKGLRVPQIRICLNFKHPRPRVSGVADTSAVRFDRRPAPSSPRHPQRRCRPRAPPPARRRRGPAILTFVTAGAPPRGGEWFVPAAAAGLRRPRFGGSLEVPAACARAQCRRAAPCRGRALPDSTFVAPVRPPGFRARATAARPPAVRQAPQSRPAGRPAGRAQRPAARRTQTVGAPGKRKRRPQNQERRAAEAARARARAAGPASRRVMGTRAKGLTKGDGHTCWRAGQCGASEGGAGRRGASELARARGLSLSTPENSVPLAVVAARRRGAPAGVLTSIDAAGARAAPGGLVMALSLRPWAGRWSLPRAREGAASLRVFWGQGGAGRAQAARAPVASKGKLLGGFVSAS